MTHVKMSCAGQCVPTCNLCPVLFTRTCRHCGRQYIRSLEQFNACPNCPGENSCPTTNAERLAEIEVRQAESRRLLALLRDLVVL
jgi:hypothetical protein